MLTFYGTNQNQKPRLEKIQNLSMFSCLYICLIIKQQQFTFEIMQT